MLLIDERSGTAAEFRREGSAVDTGREEPVSSNDADVEASVSTVDGTTDGRRAETVSKMTDEVLRLC